MRCDLAWYHFQPGHCIADHLLPKPGPGKDGLSGAPALVLAIHTNFLQPQFPPNPISPSPYRLPHPPPALPPELPVPPWEREEHLHPDACPGPSNPPGNQASVDYQTNPTTPLFTTNLPGRKPRPTPRETQEKPSPTHQHRPRRPAFRLHDSEITLSSSVPRPQSRTL